jgi:hypothetical protein
MALANGKGSGVQRAPQEIEEGQEGPPAACGPQPPGPRANPIGNISANAIIHYTLYMKPKSQMTKWEMMPK